MKTLIHTRDVILSTVLLLGAINDHSSAERETPPAARANDNSPGGRPRIRHSRDRHSFVAVEAAQADRPPAVRAGGNRPPALIKPDSAGGGGVRESVPAAFFARVDIIVVNRHRQIRKWLDWNWRRDLVVKREFTETWWVSFWTLEPLPGFPGPSAVVLSDRGWWPASEVARLAPCSDGFAVEKKGRPDKPGMTVIAAELWVIDSPFDWELEHRMWPFYRPIGK